MMSRPDFMAKQILFLESDKCKNLKFRNSNLVLLDEKNKVLIQHSLHKIFMVFVYGEFTITSVLVKNVKKHAIPLIFLNYNLRVYFSVIPDNKGNFLLRKKQYHFNNNLIIAKHTVRNKIQNQLTLMKSLRYKTVNDKQSISDIESSLKGINKCENSQELLGIEGSASKLFFQTYFKNMAFTGRKPRCKSDIINLLLDIGYHYLFNFIEANLELYGFDTYCGFYHKFFYQRKSLVCDLIEPFRCIIDKRVRKSYNLKQINISEFKCKGGQYHIKKGYNKKYSRLFLKEILLHKEQIFIYVQQYYRSFIKERNISDFPIFTVKK